MIIKGQNISFRYPGYSNAEFLFKKLSDKIYSRLAFSPYPYSLEMAIAFIRRSQKATRLKTDYIFIIMDNKSQDHLGMLSLRGLSYRHKHAEIGCWISKDHWGQGIATEAIGLALRYAFRHLKFERIYANVFPQNKASLKILKKNNFRQECLLRKHIKHKNRYIDTYIFGILKHEYLTLKAHLNLRDQSIRIVNDVH